MSRFPFIGPVGLSLPKWGARAVEQSKVRKRPDAEKQQLPCVPNVWNTWIPQKQIKPAF